MSRAFSEVTENVFRFEDTCNVYVIRRGAEAILVDFGSGQILDHLREIGVEGVRAILHTHHHRDQAQGDSRAVEAGIPIFVPLHERHLFDRVEAFWTTKQLYDVYNVRNTYFTLTKSVRISGVLEDYSTYSWRNIKLEILPTPGHTVGSVSLMGRIDGALIAFIGDLIYSPGKVQTLYDMQYGYGAIDGIEAAILSLNDLEEKKPKILCPSHGDGMAPADSAIGRTRENLRDFFRLQSGGKLAVDEVDFTPVASRLLHGTQACSSFYVIISRDGKRAIFVDYGAPNPPLFQPPAVKFEPGERVRFIRHSLSRLRNQYGIREIEAVIPSHYHDDHINGIPYLQRAMGTEVWAYQNMKEILENPAGELIGCVCPDPIKVSRTFRDHERFSWEGIDFEVHFSPGHCDYHMSMFTQMDGKRIAFSGDNVWPPTFVPSLIYRNHLHRTSHQMTAKLYKEYRPEILCSGHGLFTNVAPEGYDLFMDNARRLTELFDKLLPEGSGITGIEPSWIQIYPYQSAGDPGSKIDLEVRVHNPIPSAAKVEFDWVIPEGWRVKPRSGKMELPEGKNGRRKFEISIPSDYVFTYPKQAIALDVTLNGKHIGQITEGVVEGRPYGPAAVRPKEI
ncbi:MAG: MBL fold metallo-hydrolase [bacterium]